MGRPVVETIKNVLPPRRWRALRRATNRLRWLLKLRLLRQYRFPIARRPIRALRYVLWDPEVESFTYDLLNAAEMAVFVANVLGVDVHQAARWIDEARTDPLLTRDRGFHWSSKRRQPLGNRALWYAVIRATKPKLVVEAGVHEGLGSEMMLVALRRNAAEGHPGKLISFDIHADTGWLVAPELRDNWELVLESTLTGIARAMRGRKVDLFVHETPHVHEFIVPEVATVARHAGERLIVLDTSGCTCSALEEICDACGTSCHYFLDEPLDHIVRSNGTNLALFEGDSLARAGATPVRRGGERRPVGLVTAVAVKVLVAAASCADALGLSADATAAVALALV
jgi:hypothetical protein